MLEQAIPQAIEPPQKISTFASTNKKILLNLSASELTGRVFYGNKKALLFSDALLHSQKLF